MQFYEMRTAVLLVLIFCLVKTLCRPAKLEENDPEEADYEGGNEDPGSDLAREEDESRQPMAAAQEDTIAETQGFQKRRMNAQAAASDRAEANSDDAGPQAVEESGSEDTDAQEASEDEQPVNANRYNNQPALNKPEVENKPKFEELTVDESILSESIKPTSLGKQRLSSKYFKMKSSADQKKQLISREAKSLQSERSERNDEIKKNKMFDSKCKLKNKAQDGDLLFTNEDNHVESQDRDKSGYYSNDLADINEQERYLKHYYKTLQSKNKDNQHVASRERREVDDKSKNDNSLPMATESNGNEGIENPSTETEEAAIKRHVKKLSAKEFDELLASLSDDKRELLKKIMSDEPELSDNINKREITKKAGAAASDENNFLESIQADVSKLQEGTSGDGVADSQPSTSTQTSKESETTDMTELSVSKNSSPSSFATAEIKIDLIDHSAELNLEKSKNEALIVESNNIKEQQKSESQQTAKIQTKREANDESSNNQLVDDNRDTLATKDESNEQGYMCPLEDEFAEDMNEDPQFQNVNGNSLKREADISESIKSLEESFPNSNAYEDNPYGGSILAPLIRVKRKNKDCMKKRAIGFPSESKVAYFPYRAENDDEDNDEGNEFDDDGFFDRTSNLAKSNLNENTEEELPVDADTPQFKFLRSGSKNSKNNVRRSKVSQVDTMESDKMSIGSDSDGVVSGVEGVDDNLMINSASRNKRSDDNSNADSPDIETKANRPLRSTPQLMDDEVKSATNNLLSPANFEENSFGSLPRNYDGELSRYKRIRRVKQNPSQEVAAPNT